MDCFMKRILLVSESVSAILNNKFDLAILDMQLPWLAALWCIIGIFTITWITMRYSTAGLQGRNIIETIR